MQHDTQFPTSYDLEPLRYIPLVQEVQATLHQQLSLDMLASANQYGRIAEQLKQRIFPETEHAIIQTTPSKYYRTELKSSEGRLVFKESFLLEIELSTENGLFFFQNTKLNILGSGFTKEEALKDFSEFFIHDYLSYKNTPLRDLTPDARQLLDEYESVIAKFESA